MWGYNRTIQNNTSTNSTFLSESTYESVKKLNEKFAMIGYWKTVTPKIFFTTTLSIGSILSSTDNSTLRFGSSALPYTKPDYLSKYEFGFENKYYTFRLEPTMGYLINKSFGLNITFGGLNYENNFASKDRIKYQNVNFNINPKNWKFGLFYYLSKK